MSTYNNVHRSRPETNSAVALDEDVRLSFVPNFSISAEFPSVTRGATNVLEFKDGLDNLCNTVLRVLSAGAVVEASTVEVVRSEWPFRINL
jgi:hypothetical protein